VTIVITHQLYAQQNNGPLIFGIDDRKTPGYTVNVSGGFCYAGVSKGFSEFQFLINDLISKLAQCVHIIISVWSSGKFPHFIQGLMMGRRNGTSGVMGCGSYAAK